MTRDLTFQCRCGAVRGAVRDVSPSRCNHAVCYCDDCQAYVRWLGADALTDARGGTDIVQVSPSQVTFTQGFERVKLMRLSPKGLLRWYAECCRVPVANMVSAKVPFVGLWRPGLVDATEHDIGPTVGVQGRFAKGGAPPGVSERAPVGMLVHAGSLMLRWWLGGRGRPTPFFDDAGAPRVAPEVITREARAKLYV